MLLGERTTNIDKDATMHSSTPERGMARRRRVGSLGLSRKHLI